MMVFQNYGISIICYSYGEKYVSLSHNIYKNEFKMKWWYKCQNIKYIIIRRKFSGVFNL